MEVLASSDHFTWTAGRPSPSGLRHRERLRLLSPESSHLEFFLSASPTSASLPPLGALANSPHPPVHVLGLPCQAPHSNTCCASDWDQTDPRDSFWKDILKAMSLACARACDIKTAASSLTGVSVSPRHRVLSRRRTGWHAGPPPQELPAAVVDDAFPF